MPRETYWDVIDSPVGPLCAVADGEGFLIELRLDGTHPAGGQPKRLAAVRDQLGEYFSGRRREFDLPLRPRGTAFQQRVWQMLQTIPFGQLLSYRGLAERLGNAAATRAVGRANGANPIAIVIPCHRVIASDGSLGGYGGGLRMKAQLLALEGHRYEA
ncbi:MAG TPA: methylated-DNA--[protein]-cysteine S-methyltransferase [Gammaproteobacteria bacterium]